MIKYMDMEYTQTLMNVNKCYQMCARSTMQKFFRVHVLSFGIAISLLFRLLSFETEFSVSVLHLFWISYLFLQTDKKLSK